MHAPVYVLYYMGARRAGGVCIVKYYGPALLRGLLATNDIHNSGGAHI